ncbi:PREDICTED: LOW QUALITY PROTEIN: dimethylaniline monooxygenase [N-oxide-forming] 5 [Myotis davidii]|uniref:LOW QUALITY PROTEIN: dimethylaniline monooxygenase [N-oxide-forming] 5 n=1 Tax=Myotis davidii TaxID=225400 RepID=UPI00076773D5|nr:PREDICTED: LOW QUALITY PROTEIN: dimethylaniline monooxygenase [N-oxide-forming] 5 [Myotis davidii]
MTHKRIAVIGAGVSGLTSIKCCLDEGLEPVCFERTDDIGGLWRFQENPEEGRASIYKSVIINTSKEMMCFSDYPIPDHFPNFMHNSQVLEYFRMYAKEFNLLKYIQLKVGNFVGTFVFEVVCQLHEQCGLIYQCLPINIGLISMYLSYLDKDCTLCLLCAINYHLIIILPYLAGIEKFKGQYFHSRDYKNPERFTGKRVIVIGIGNSGSDLAVEISHTAKQPISIRPFPNSMDRPRRRPLASCLTASIKTEFYFHVTDFSLPPCPHDHSSFFIFGLHTTHRALSQHPTVNDDLPNRIISGLVKVKGNVKEFTETAAIFEDGSREDDIDAVIFATGYSFAFPFLEDSVRVVRNKISLYKKVFPPSLEKPTLAIIGLIQPLGAIMPISELQGRWATQVFKGLKTLPSQSEMITEITKAQEQMAKR